MKNTISDAKLCHHFEFLRKEFFHENPNFTQKKKNCLIIIFEILGEK
jgi:hypothetical protein